MSFVGAVKSDNSRDSDEFNGKRKGRGDNFRGKCGHECGNDNR